MTRIVSSAYLPEKLLIQTKHSMRRVFFNLESYVTFDKNSTYKFIGIQNNQQLMVIISEIDRDESNSKEAMYDRIRKIKMDVEAIVDSNRQLFEVSIRSN